jgi:hypothetical protein
VGAGEDFETDGDFEKTVELDWKTAVVKVSERLVLLVHQRERAMDSRVNSFDSMVARMDSGVYTIVSEWEKTIGEGWKTVVLRH